MNKVWVYIDHFKGEALGAAWEALGAGRSLAEQLGSGVTALALGENLEALASLAFQYGADEVVLAEEATLGDFRPEPYCSLLARLAREATPEAMLFPTTTRGRELAAMLGIDLNTGVLADVTALEVKEGAIVATRPMYAGKLLAKVTCRTRPQLVTLRGRAFPRPALDPARTGTPVKAPAGLAESEIFTRVEGYTGMEGGVSLADAAVIVAGGRGVANNPALTPPAGMDEKAAETWKAEQGFALLRELAQVLGGAVGASRAAVDANYIAYPYQIGQTGKMVAPDLYIACGISGAIQHLAGMRASKMIVAINADAEAPIFKLARYGVVGDMHTIVPALTAAVRERMNK